MLVKIDKNVPMPAYKSRQKYPWHTMEVGDSFVYPNRDVGQYASIMSVRYSPKKFIGRTVEGVNRIWRVE